MPRKTTILALLTAALTAAVLLTALAGPATAAPKFQTARFKVEVKGVQQMYSQRTHEAENECDISDTSSGSEKVVFKSKPVVILAVHSPGVFNPDLLAETALDGIPATATVTRNYTPRISGPTGAGCQDNGGGSESVRPQSDCGTKTVSPFRLDLAYDEEAKSQLDLLAGLDEDPFHDCVGAGELGFPNLIVEKTNGKGIYADVSQDQLFDPQFGKWIALADGTKRYDGDDYWIKTKIHWDVSFTRLASK